jgi:hypothetical protein
MKKSYSLRVITTLGLAMLACVQISYAQQVALTTNTSGKPFFRSAELKTGQIQKLDFSVQKEGSVTGRVFADEELNSAPGVDPQGIQGVKVSLRSRDAGYENFVIEQFTDETGSYEFHYLVSGNYTIEIDPANLPSVKIEVDEPEKTVDQDTPAPAPIQRSISGTVFIDKDGDGSYKPGKDKLIEGADVLIEGRNTVSDSNGAYVFNDLPPGRIELRVMQPKHAEPTHIVFDLPDGPVKNRVINVPLRAR